MRIVRTMLLSAALLAGSSLFASAQYNGGVYQNGVYVGPVQYSDNSAYQRGWKDGQDDARHGRQSSTRVDRSHNDAERAAYNQGYAQGYQSWVSQSGGYNGNGQVYAPNGQVYGGNNGRNNGRWGRNRRHGDGDCDSDDAYCNGQPNPNYRGNRGNAGTYYPNGTYNGGYNGGYNNGYNNGAQVAQQYGYNDGLREGQSDRATGHSYRPTQDTGYRLATNGYRAEYGSRDQYKQWYRDAYQQGYQQGYNGGVNNNGYRWPR